MMSIYRKPLTAVVFAAALMGAAPVMATGDGMVIVAPEQADWRPVNPALPDGPEIAILRGDPATGPSDMLLKMKKGAGPMHLHTHDYHLAVISGVMKHWDESGDEETSLPLGPGGYYFQPGGAVHGGACQTDECIMFVHWAGPRDAMLPRAEESSQG